MRFDIGSVWRGKHHPATKEVKKSISESLKVAYRTGRHKMAFLGKHLSKEHKEKIRQTLKKIYSTPKAKSEVDKVMTEWWQEHPKAKKSLAERMKQYFSNNPKAFKKFMQGGKSSKMLDVKSKLGLVRSLGEQQIANYLFYNRIKARYEPLTLFLDDWLCTPDFYLEKTNWFIEFYGGFPEAEKKRRIKNRIYKKYNIPVIAMMPDDLRDLSFLTRLKKQTSSRWKKFVAK